MKKTQKKKTGVLSVLCYILAALFFLYGVYMVIYAVDYIQSYESTGLIDKQNVIQYVVTSSASYLGFAVLLFATGYGIHLLKNLQPALIGTITEEVIANPVETGEPTAETEEPAAEMPAEPEVPEITEAPEPIGEPAEVPELAAEPEAAPAEDLPAKDTPDAFEESSVPQIGDTSSALTFHELIIDPPENNPEGSDEEAWNESEPDKPIEKISSSMIRDIFEHK